MAQGAESSIEFDPSTCAKYGPKALSMLAEVVDMADFAYSRTLAGLGRDPLSLLTMTEFRVLSNTFNVFFSALQSQTRGALSSGDKAPKLIGLSLYSK